MCSGKVVFPAPCSSVSHLPLGSHRSVGPSSHERRESKCFFQSCRGVSEGLSYDPASHSHCGVAKEPSPVPIPSTRRRCGGSTVTRGPSSIPVPASLQGLPTAFRLINQPVLLLSNIPQRCQGVDAALGAGLSVQPSHNPRVPASPAWLSSSVANVNLGVLLNYAIM